MIGRCANNGWPLTPSIKLNERKSTKCNCKARFSLHSVTGEMRLAGEHADECKPVAEAELQNNAYYFKLAQSPSKEIVLKEIVVQRIRSEWSTGNRSLQKTLNGNRLICYVFIYDIALSF